MKTSIKRMILAGALAASVSGGGFANGFKSDCDELQVVFNKYCDGIIQYFANASLGEKEKNKVLSEVNEYGSKIEAYLKSLSSEENLQKDENRTLFNGKLTKFMKDMDRLGHAYIKNDDLVGRCCECIIVLRKCRENCE